MLVYGLRSTSDDWLGWSMDSNPISSQNNEMLIFGLCSTSDDQLGWSMDSNTICHPSPAKNMKYSFLDYVQHLMISWAGQWTRTLSATCLQPLKWNAHFWITFNFWWLAGLVNGLKPHLPPLSSHKKEMLIFGLHSTSNDQLAGGWTWTPSTTPLQPKKWNAHFWITFNFWWLAGLVDGLKPHMPPLSSQKNEMLIFGLCSTSDDWLGWSMDSNPICHLSPGKKNEILVFRLRSTSDDWPGWSMDLNPICHLSPGK